MNHERSGWWQEEERPSLESLKSWHEDLFGSQQSFHTVVSCSCVKGGSALQGFLPRSLGQTPAKEFFKLECTNNNKLDRISSFKHPWSFPDTPVPFQLSAALGGLEAVCWMKRDPTDDSAATLFFFLLVCFSSRSSGDVIWHQTLTNPSSLLTPSNFFYFLFIYFFSETVHCDLNKMKLFSQKAPY